MDDLIRQLKQIYVLLDDSERRALRSVALTPTQVGLLSAVFQSEDGQTISALARALLCTRGNATRLVRRMTQYQLLVATGHEQDRRLVVVRLTDQGRLLLSEAQQALSMNAARLQKSLAPTALDRLTPACAELIDALKQRLTEQ